jgi:hypothetical protein
MRPRRARAETITESRQQRLLSEPGGAGRLCVGVWRRGAVVRRCLAARDVCASVFGGAGRLCVGVWRRWRFVRRDLADSRTVCDAQVLVRRRLAEKRTDPCAQNQREPLVRSRLSALPASTVACVRFRLLADLISRGRKGVRLHPLRLPAAGGRTFQCAQGVAAASDRSEKSGPMTAAVAKRARFSDGAKQMRRQQRRCGGRRARTKRQARASCSLLTARSGSDDSDDVGSC